jgi:hypothetical protein
MTIYEQADTSSRTASGFRYCWMLDRKYAARTEMIRWGWKWIAGPQGGTFLTDDLAAVLVARAMLRLPAPKSNGTHAALAAPMHPFPTA